MNFAIQLAQLLFILSLFTYGSYYVAKKIKKKQLDQISQNHMIQVVDGVQIGTSQGVYLLKVGKEYVLMTSGTNGSHMLTMNQTEFENPKEKFDELFGTVSPQKKWHLQPKFWFKGNHSK